MGGMANISLARISLASQTSINFKIFERLTFKTRLEMSSNDAEWGCVAVELPKLPHRKHYKRKRKHFLLELAKPNRE